MTILTRLAFIAMIGALSACSDVNTLTSVQVDREEPLLAQPRASSHLRPDRLGARLSHEPGSCILAVRHDNGQYVSRVQPVEQLALRPSTQGTIRFVYRGWAEGDTFPSNVAICTLANTARAVEAAHKVFSSTRVVRTVQALNRSPARWHSNTDPLAHDERSVVIPVELSDPPVAVLEAEGTVAKRVRRNRDVALNVVCSPNPIVPEEGCPPPGEGGGGGGGGGSPTYCDPSAVIPALGCFFEGETPITEPPYYGTPPTTPPSTTTSDAPIFCFGRLDDLHLSDAPSQFGLVSVHAITECDAPVPSIATNVFMFRTACFIDIICSHYPIQVGVAIELNRRYADANAKVDVCGWGKGLHWFTASATHMAIKPNGFVATANTTHKPYSYGFHCLQGINIRPAARPSPTVPG